MKLVTFSGPDKQSVGVLEQGSVVDLAGIGFDDMVDLIAGGDAALAEVATALGREPRIPVEEVTIEAPLRPRKNVLAVGRNYLEHIHEVKSEVRPVPEHPIIFSKPPTSVIGPGAAIDTSNDPSGTTDYEGELAVVIGVAGKRIAAGDAWGHVFGYTIVNDVTARAIQRRHNQWFIGKGPDTFCPMGPCLVTADEMGDVEEVWVRTSVNGEERQAAPVADLIFDIPELIATISSVMTLEPGDVIATGTPSGVGIGFDPPVYLSPGDVVEVTVDGIGTLSNPVV